MENKVLKEHNLELNNRNFLKISGVEKVIAITEKETILNVLSSTLTITGTGLKAENLSVENGIIILSGLVESLKYSEKKEKIGLIKKIFK